MRVYSSFLCASVIIINGVISMVDAELFNFFLGNRPPAQRLRIKIARPSEKVKCDDSIRYVIHGVRMPPPVPDTSWGEAIFVPKGRKKHNEQELGNDEENKLGRSDYLEEENETDSEVEKRAVFHSSFQPKKKKYYLGVHKASWFEARQKCDLTDQALATVMNQEESDLMAETITKSGFQKYRFWIGGNDIRQEGIFVWGVNTTLTYTNWNLHQPDNNKRNENCVEVVPYIGFKWNDANCYRLRIVSSSSKGGVQPPSSSSVRYAVHDVRVPPNIPDTSWEEAIFAPIGKKKNFEEELGNEEENKLERSDSQEEEDDETEANAEEVAEPLQPSFQSKEKKFLLGTDRVTWFEAKYRCNGNNQELATVMNQKEADLLTDTIRKSGYEKNRFWIGGNDLKYEGVFVWGINTPMPYTNWNQYQPDNDGGNENCMEVLPFRGFKWNDFTCEAKILYICEYY